MQITANVWQVGGSGLTAPEDAGIYLLRLGGAAALIDAGCGGNIQALIHNIAKAIPENVPITHLCLTHCHFVNEIGAVVLAAGLSRRMGRPKLTLSWGKSTVIGTVVQAILNAGINQIMVVTGGARQEVESVLAGFPIETIYNPAYEQGEMLSSVQVGITAPLAPPQPMNVLPLARRWALPRCQALIPGDDV